jgi:ATP-NAD kinase C-terminal domain
VSGEPVLDLTGDGLVVASPTGSNAYTVGAGGPAVSLTLDAIVLTPLAAQGTPLRSMVLDESDRHRCSAASFGGSSLRAWSRAQEHLDRFSLVHCPVAGGGFVERQFEVEDLARVDLAIPDQVDQLGQKAAHWGRPSV